MAKKSKIKLDTGAYLAAVGLSKYIAAVPSKDERKTHADNVVKARSKTSAKKIPSTNAKKLISKP